jgi:hypothetical protein
VVASEKNGRKMGVASVSFFLFSSLYVLSLLFFYSPIPGNEKDRAKVFENIKISGTISKTRYLVLKHWQIFPKYFFSSLL